MVAALPIKCAVRLHSRFAVTTTVHLQTLFLTGTLSPPKYQPYVLPFIPKPPAFSLFMLFQFGYARNLM